MQNGNKVLDEKSLFLGKGTVDDLPNLTRRSPLVPIIHNITKKLEEGGWREINQETVKGGTWASVVRKMRKSGELDDRFNVERRGEKFYFVHRAAEKKAA